MVFANRKFSTSSIGGVGRVGGGGRVGRVGGVGRVGRVGDVGRVGRVGDVGRVGRSSSSSSVRLAHPLRSNQRCWNRFDRRYGVPRPQRTFPDHFRGGIFRKVSGAKNHCLAGPSSRVSPYSWERGGDIVRCLTAVWRLTISKPLELRA